jgi:hypothetical protein
MRSLARLIGCAATTAALMISGSVSVTSAEDVIFPAPKPIISPFSKISIQTGRDHLVQMSYDGILFRSMAITMQTGSHEKKIALIGLLTAGMVVGISRNIHRSIFKAVF